ncbi:MAG: hypothetical protein R3D85_14825 [Paracoccaceae bacterium]
MVDNAVLDGKVCIGNDCVAAETFTADQLLKLRSDVTNIDFIDTTPAANGGGRNWRIKINADGTFGGTDYFGIQDLGSDTLPFRIAADAPSVALWISDAGDLGMGTSIPEADLHITRPSSPSIRLEQSGAGGATPHSWEMRGSDQGLYVYSVFDNGGWRIPFQVSGDASFNALVVGDDGLVGLGLQSPQAGLHLRRTDGQAGILVEEGDATTSPRTLLNLVNNGRPEIVLANTDTGEEWSFGGGTKFILKQGARGSASSAKAKLLEIDRTGDAILAGSLTTGGTTCGSGCDAVFAPDYPLPSIADHAARMQALGYLPNVGPTPEGAPLNVTDKLGRMLNELEHAHLYIAQLSRENAEQKALNARLEARLARIEARLTD